MPETQPVVPAVPAASMGAAPSAAPVVPKSVGLFQDPHFIGILTQIGGVAIWGASHLALIPSPVQPWVALAGGLAGLIGSLFHVKGLMDPASTQTVPTSTSAASDAPVASK